MKKVLFLLVTALMVACTQPLKTTLSVRNDTINIIGDSTKHAYMYYNIDDVHVDSVFIKLDTTMAIEDFLYADYGLAYKMATQNGQLNISLSIPNRIDTMIVFHREYQSPKQYNTIATGFNYAKIIQNTDFAQNAPKVRKWLYSNQIKNTPDSIIEKIIGYNQMLQQIEIVRKEHVTFQNVYILHDKTPIISTNEQKPLPQLYVKTDMAADHYYLFWASNDSELNYLIEWQCTNNFDKGCRTLPSKLTSYRANSNSGTYCIFLVGINDDWETQVCPIGLVCIDNEAPENNYHLLANIGNDPEGYALIYFKQGIKILIPYDKSARFRGGATITYGSFEGHGNVLRIPYTFSWWGDVRYIRITNERTSDWGSFLTAPKTIIIDTHKNSSPHKATFNTYLPNTGDNYLPLEIEDERGNKSAYTINIATRRVDNNPQINIDNNIYNNNY